MLGCLVMLFDSFPPIIDREGGVVGAHGARGPARVDRVGGQQGGQQHFLHGYVEPLGQEPRNFFFHLFHHRYLALVVHLKDDY